MASLLGGSGGQSSYTQSGSNSISGPVPGSPYEVFQNNQLANIDALSQRPYQPYDVSKMFAGFNPAQTDAFSLVNDANYRWQPYMNSANSALTAGSTGAQNAFGAAAGSPSATQSASPYMQTAAQMTPSILDQYMSPYIDKSVNAANALASKNFLQNVMPGVTNQFVASGGGLGGKNYGRDMNWALTNFNDSANRNTQNALASGFFNSAQLAQGDLSRQAGLASTAGQLASADMQNRTNLGTAQANAATNLGGAFANLGTNYLNNQLTGANALLQTGNQQQQQAQLPLTAAYEQFKEGQQWPYQTAGWAANTANQYSWPMRQNTQGWQSTQGSSSQEGSILGSVLGGLSTIGSLAIPGAGGASAIGNLMGGVGKMFGSAGGGTAPKSGGYIGRGRDGYFSLDDGNSTRRLAGRYNHGGSVTRYSNMPGMQVPGEARTIHPFNTFGEPLSRGFFNYSPRIERAPKTEPAFANTYKKGGKVTPVEAVHKHERVMHGAKKSELTKFAAGGVVPVIKVALDNTKRSNAATKRRKQLQKQMARRGTPVDLEPRSGYFQ